jgi:peroxiredoxin
MLKSTPLCNFGWKAPDFHLQDPNGNSYSLQSVAGKKGTLVAFICNHCPYVKAIISRLVKDAKTLKNKGIHTVAIMSNDYQAYPEDHPTNMQKFAQQHGFVFPYLIDETQAVAKAYGAICTPDFFGFNANNELQYRGRLDDARLQDASHRVPELVEAMLQVAETGRGPEQQSPSMGCSIKWKE